MFKLNRYDKALMIFIVISALALYATLVLFVQSASTASSVAVVSYKSEEIMRIDLSKNANYTVQGTLGDVVIEVKDQKIRVEKETSPYHLCSIQGWVQYTAVPIVCLPNDIVILIENAERRNNEDTVIQ